MDKEWIYIGACQYATDHFSLWMKPVKKQDGSYTMKTKSKRTTLQQINIDAKGRGAKYLAKITNDE
jgi:hypothetical protein